MSGVPSPRNHLTAESAQGGTRRRQEKEGEDWMWRSLRSRSALTRSRSPPRWLVASAQFHPEMDETSSQTGSPPSDVEVHQQVSTLEQIWSLNVEIQSPKSVIPRGYLARRAWLVVCDASERLCHRIGQLYAVQSGNTIDQLASKFGRSWKELMSLNRDLAESNGSVISTDQVSSSSSSSDPPPANLDLDPSNLPYIVPVLAAAIL
eukprot:754335-Hanusia_phi.AAC.1